MPGSARPAEKRVPLSLVLLTIGLIALATALSLAWLMPAARVPLPHLLPRATVASPVAGATAGQSQAILLPETPLEPSRTSYLSFGTPEEAGLISAGSPGPGQPIRLQIPALGVEAPVREVGLNTVVNDGQVLYQWAVPDRYEAGWHGTSARLGQPGNTVINGHNNILGEVFKELVDLRPGDRLLVHDPDQAFEYEVERVHTLPEEGQPLSVRLANARWIEATDDERLTLVSCWPHATNTHRVVVVARPVLNQP